MMAPRDGFGALQASLPAAQVTFLPDGSSVRVAANRAEIRDRADRVVVRYEDGRAEVVAPAGDLHLEAPQGRIVMHGRDGVELVTPGEGTQGPYTSFRLEPGELKVRTVRASIEAEHAHLAVGVIGLFARRLATTAVELSHNVERWDLRACRMVERTRDLLREVEQLAQERVGQLRVQVRETATVLTRRTVMRSADDTSIDGRRVLLG